MTEQEARGRSAELMRAARFAVLATINEDGYPEARAILNLPSDGFVAYVTTNTSSRKVAQVRTNPRASIHYADREHWRGLTLIGDAEIVVDRAVKARFFEPGHEKYYPQGVDDPDYTILRVTPKRARYYGKLHVVEFTP